MLSGPAKAFWRCEMLTRIISGTIGAAILVLVLFLPSYALALTVLAASAIGLYEFRRALKNRDINIDLTISIIFSLIISAKAYAPALPAQFFSGLPVFLRRVLRPGDLDALLIVLVIYLFCRVIFDKSRFKPEDLAWTLAGILYIPFLLSFTVKTRIMDMGFEFIWLIMIGSIITDTFAYFVGVSVGRTKIIPHISPKKTVEGSIGGAAGCMLFMILYGAFVINKAGTGVISLYHFAAMGLLCGVVSQLGDWAASAIKRFAGIKDYGTLIPGHGGIMDRADSILFVAPVVYIYVNLFI